MPVRDNFHLGETNCYTLTIAVARSIPSQGCRNGRKITVLRVSRSSGTDVTPGPDLAAAVALTDRLQRALGQGDRASIVACLSELVEIRAPMGPQWQQLACIAADHGELGLSRDAMALYVEATGNDPRARYHQAALLAQGRALRQAYAILRDLPEDVPDPAANAYSRGAAALFLGETDEARERLERAARLRPDLGHAWLPLSTLVDFAREPRMMEWIVEVGRAMEAAPPATRAVYFYALGKAYADLGETAQAFAAFARGAEIKRAEGGYDAARDAADATEAVRGYDARAIESIARAQTEPTGRTIFVTGLPRSGTTLVEQILTSHSEVSDGGEINRLRMLAREIGGTSRPALARYLESRGPDEAAQVWNHWLAERFPGGGRIVDKSTDTSRYLGLAAALLPEAPIVWLKRDPLDCAWSCFRTHFLAGVSWSYDLADIAHHFRLEDELLARWQDILGDRVLVVPYEGLVADSAGWIRRILAHCQLSEEPEAFSPHENRRAVTTSSVMQVRRPINRAAVGAAEPYRAFLQPFVDAYADLVQA